MNYYIHILILSALVNDGASRALEPLTSEPGLYVGVCGATGC